MVVLGLLISLISFGFAAEAQELPPPYPNQNIEHRLATVWDISEQDVCQSGPAVDDAWTLSPSITTRGIWYLSPNGSCIDQRGEICVWNYVDGYLQVVFKNKQRTYVARPGGNFLSISGVIKHLDNPSLQGCFNGSTNQPPSWVEPRRDETHRPTTLPPVVFDPTPQNRASPN